jgi:hypothetical protein
MCTLACDVTCNANALSELLLDLNLDVWERVEEITKERIMTGSTFHEPSNRKEVNYPMKPDESMPCNSSGSKINSSLLALQPRRRRSTLAFSLRAIMARFFSRTLILTLA